MPTLRSDPVDGFRLAYDDTRSQSPAGPAVVLLHGWPGDRGDHRELAARLAPHARVVVPDLRGFGESDKHAVDPSDGYSAAAQVRSVAGLIDQLGLGAVVVGGYDVGSRVAQTLAGARPDLVRALVIAPPVPGAGRRVLDPDSVTQFWYQSFHNLELSERLIDGRPDAVHAYLAHFWRHWSGPDFVLSDAELDRLVGHYAAPGAFTASIAWYRAGAGTLRSALQQKTPDPADRIAVPTTVLWPEHDPLFPREWSDHLDDFFAHVELRMVDGVGHFAPLEYPDELATAIRSALTV